MQSLGYKTNLRSFKSKLYFLYIVFSLTFIISSLTLNNTSIYAQQEQTNKLFSTKISSTYTIKPNGNAQVEHRFTITNLTPTKYVDKYAIELSLTKLTNITAYEGNNYSKPHVVVGQNSTSIALDFKDPVVGLNQTKQFTIQYQTNDVASLIGQVLEVNIPKIKGQSYNRRDVVVQLSSKFSNLSYFNLKPSKIETKDGKKLFYFNNVKDQAINLIFGDQQVFDLSLRYDLVNKSQSEGVVQIALPPNTRYQQVYYQSIQPEPLKLTQDEEGNWLASYKLKPKETKTIDAGLTVKLTLKDNKLPIPQPSTKLYLAETNYWPVKNAKIQSIVKSHNSILDLYRFTVNNLSYSANLANHQRLGALKVLKEPNQAACEEFSDLFITLARASGTPARRLVGYGYTNDPKRKPTGLGGKDVLHAWVDWLDPKTNSFRAADPTWEKTTGGRDYFNSFDLNHIVFTINGLNDSKPLPAGTYVSDQTANSQNITVKLSRYWPEIKPSFDLKLLKGSLNLPGMYELELTNNTGVAWYLNNLQFGFLDQKAKVILLSQPTLTFLPFETKRVKILVISQDMTLKRTNLAVTLTFHNSSNYLVNLKSTITAMPTFGLETSTQIKLVMLILSAVFSLGIVTTIYLVKLKRN